MSYLATVHFPEHHPAYHTQHEPAMNSNKRIDWTSMAYQDEDEVKKTDSHLPVDHEPAPKSTTNSSGGLSEVSPAGIIFDYDEPGDSKPAHEAAHHLTESVWHNAMMHVDGDLNASDTYHSMPHWSWVDDE
ncbi:hypothetical protein JCM8097_000371 [Rhodosporidiobolus ruineniae]